MTLTCWLPPNISESRKRTSLARLHESHSLSSLSLSLYDGGAPFPRVGFGRAPKLAPPSRDNAENMAADSLTSPVTADSHSHSTSPPCSDTITCHL
jgi:hypothetical protein